MRVWRYIPLIAVAGMLAAGLTAQAAETGCQLQNRSEELAAVQKNPLSDYWSQIRAEVAARRKLLAATIDCATSEVQSLRSNLKNTPAQSPEAAALKANAIQKLDRAEEYYRSRRTEANTTGLRGNQELAQSIREWRQTNYAPLAQRTTNLIFWLASQDLFQTAQSRLDQIRNTIQISKLIQDEEVQNQFRATEKIFGEAQGFNNQAREVFEREGPPEEALVKTKSALESLNRTYRGFLELSEGVNKLVNPPEKK
ncbi:MAG: hypothetical protein HY978_03175 [Candidatus Liptonbacteria bacterium]|nr:hypothetical protein [Candidatus Liptonbacteria bacterium]